MRINKFVALASGLSRRGADAVIAQGRILVNDVLPQVGQDITESDVVTLDKERLTPPNATQTIMLNKPADYVVSRDGQGSKTVYDLLPPNLQYLKPIGRLDKNSSGLLLFTDDGALAHKLTHPSFQKTKVYEITLDRALKQQDETTIRTTGITLEDGISKLGLKALTSDRLRWQVTMHEGRNRQIRRTFAALYYLVTNLHRTQFGTYSLGQLPSGQNKKI